MADKIEIIIGTYEEFLLGYKVTQAEKDDKSTILSLTFSTRSHTASIRSVAVGGNYLVSGGADDKIFVYDMKSRKEVNILMTHDGTINALAFTPDNSHILSGSSDGRLAVTRTSTWQIGADWKKAHQGLAVTHISCHPSGKLALSLGTDLTLKTWNLITGRCAYKTNLKSRTNLNRQPDCLQWSPDGNHFTLCGLKVIEILSIETTKAIKEITVESRPISLCWISESDLIIGLENGKLLMTSIKENIADKYFNAHDKRVKGISFLKDILGTISSSGEVALWNVDVNKRKLQKIASTDIGCRPTCIALLDLEQFGEDYSTSANETLTNPEELTSEDEDEIVTKSTLRNIGKVTVEFNDNEESTNKKGKKHKLNKNSNKNSKKLKKCNNP